MIKTVLRQGETETCKKRYDQENDQRIRQSEQKASYHVFSAVILIGIGILHLADRIVKNHIDCIHHKNDASRHLQNANVVLDEIGNKRQSQTGKLVQRT